METTLIKLDFKIGQNVYCKSDPEQDRLTVSGIYLTFNDIVLYEVKKLSVVGFYYACELSIEKKII